MMQTKSIYGVPVTLDNGAKITNINGRDGEWYINSVANVFGDGLQRKPRLLSPVPVVVAPFVALLTSGVPIWGTPTTVMAQNEIDMIDEWDPRTGAMIRVTKGDLIMANTDLGKGGANFVCVVRDNYNGLMVDGMWTVEVINPPILTGGDPLIGVPGVPTPVPSTPITPILVDLTTQTSWEKGNQVIRGDGMIRIRADVISEQALLDCDSINITYINGDVQRFTLWSRDGSLIKEQTFYWCLYLRRLQD